MREGSRVHTCHGLLISRCSGFPAILHSLAFYRAHTELLSHKSLSSANEKYIAESWHNHRPWFIPSCYLQKAPRCHQRLLCQQRRGRDAGLQLWALPVGGWTHQQEQWEDPGENIAAAYCCATSGINLFHQIVTCKRRPGLSSPCSPDCKSRGNPSTNELAAPWAGDASLLLTDPHALMIAEYLPHALP